MLVEKVPTGGTMSLLIVVDGLESGVRVVTGTWTYVGPDGLLKVGFDSGVGVVGVTLGFGATVEGRVAGLGATVDGLVCTGFCVTGRWGLEAVWFTGL